VEISTERRKEWQAGWWPTSHIKLTVNGQTWEYAGWRAFGLNLAWMGLVAFAVLTFCRGLIGWFI
jgi:hypothetical protein